jgi:Beta-lactamase
MRRSIIITFGLFLWSTILPPFSFAQTDKLSPEKRTQRDVATARFMAKNNLPGISIAVVENGEYEWSKGFGMADLENLVPATSQTLYRLASISKPITATAAMVLWERGKLDSLEATHRSQNCKQTSPKCLFDEYFHETALWGPSGKALSAFRSSFHYNWTR